MSVVLVCIFFCTTCVRKGCWIGRSYERMWTAKWVVRIKSKSSVRKVRVPTIKPSLALSIHVFRTKLYIAENCIMR